MAVIGELVQCQFEELPYAGSGSVVISRVDDAVTISWDGETVLTGTHSAPIARVEIEFGFYARLGPPDSFFGSESVDRIALSGTIVRAEPRSWGALKARH